MDIEDLVYISLFITPLIWLFPFQGKAFFIAVLLSVAVYASVFLNIMFIFGGSGGTREIQTITDYSFYLFVTLSYLYFIYGLIQRFRKKNTIG